MDEELFEICLKCLGSKPRQTAIIYFKTPTVETRLTLTDDLVKSIIQKLPLASGEHQHSDLDVWDNLLKEIRSMLEVRNRIAHQPLIAKRLSIVVTKKSEGVEITPNEAVMTYGYELSQSNNEKLRGRNPKQKPLTLEDLENHKNKVDSVKDDLRKFRTDKLLKHV